MCACRLDSSVQGLSLWDNKRTAHYIRHHTRHFKNRTSTGAIDFLELPFSEVAAGGPSNTPLRLVKRRPRPGDPRGWLKQLQADLTAAMRNSGSYRQLPAAAGLWSPDAAADSRICTISPVGSSCWLGGMADVDGRQACASTKVEYKQKQRSS